MMLRPLLLALACTATALAARAADPVAIAWSPEGRFVHEHSLAAGQFLEVCGRLGAGASVAWAFEGSAPSDFNIHFHEGRQVRYPARQKAVAKASGTLRAASAQDYCWMWSNRAGADTTLKLSLKRE